MEKIKLDQKTVNDLFSSRTSTVIAALKTIEERGNALYMPLIFDLLLSVPETEIENEIIRLLGSVKSKDTVKYFAGALRDLKYKPIRKTLAAACWQNGLDYKDHLQVFVDLIIGEDWETGFEAFTVIENMPEFPEYQIIKEIKSHIEESLKSAEVKNRYFLTEILSIFG